VRRESVGLDSKYETRRVASFPHSRNDLWERSPPIFRKTARGKALRVMGDPNAKVSCVQLSVGYAKPAVNNPDIDVVVSGELQETDGAFDSPEYVLDAVSLGFPKGWIMLGHAISEDQIVV